MGDGVATGAVDEVCVWVCVRGAGARAGRGLSAGAGTLGESAGTEALGAWMLTGGASEVAGCGLGLDLVAAPTAKAAPNMAAAATAGSRARAQLRSRAFPGRTGSG